MINMPASLTPTQRWYISPDVSISFYVIQPSSLFLKPRKSIVGDLLSVCYG